MPSRNTIKKYIENSYYHIYNRGVEKRRIFIDAQDYGVFLSYLKEYLIIKNVDKLQNKLSNLNTTYKEKDRIVKLLRLNNFHGEITLLAYCLMPNHFHFFIKQKNALSIDKFMQSFSTRYTMYFNRKYKRVGSLFQAVYKAVLIETDEQFIYLSKYIHQQSLISLASQGETLRSSQPSSFAEYLGRRKTSWVDPIEVLSHFSKTNPALSYENFVLEKEQDDYETHLMKNLVLDED